MTPHSVFTGRLNRVLVLWLSGRGFTPAVIARASGLSAATVRKHLQAMWPAEQPTDRQVRTMYNLWDAAEMRLPSGAVLRQFWTLGIACDFRGITKAEASAWLDLAIHGQASQFAAALALAEVLSTKDAVTWDDVKRLAQSHGLDAQDAFLLVAAGAEASPANDEGPLDGELSDPEEEKTSFIIEA